jgi:hypothetical protein
MTELKYKDITEKIIGASFEVHKFLGNGFTRILIFVLIGICECRAFQEVIYQRALAYEMTKTNLEFHREIEQNIYYRDLQEPIGTRRVDFSSRKQGFS